MKKHFNLCIIICVVILQTCNNKANNTLFTNTSETIKVSFHLNTNKAPYYKVMYNDETVIDSSLLGIVLEDFNFHNNLEILNISEISTQVSFVLNKAG